MRCLRCGHVASAHWFPKTPPWTTTACRDCHRRGIMTKEPPPNLALVGAGMCCWTREYVESLPHGGRS